jgi:hypothetical protein
LGHNLSLRWFALIDLDLADLKEAGGGYLLALSILTQGIDFVGFFNIRISISFTVRYYTI